MSKWILAILAIILAAAAWTHFSSQNGITSSSDNELLEYVPEDTVLFAQSVFDKELIEFSENYPINTLSPSQMGPVTAFLESSDEGRSTSAFLSALSESIFQGKAQTYGNLFSGLDLKQDGAVVFYLQGALPVIRITLNDNAAADSALANAIEKSGWTPKKVTIGEASVHVWELSRTSAGSAFSLAITTHKNILTATVLTTEDSEEIKKQRLGLQKPSRSLAASDTLKNLRKAHAFLPGYLSYVDINGIAQGILSPSTNNFGKDLIRLGKENFNALTQGIDQSCKTDYARIFAAVPRLSFGYNTMNVSGNSMDMTGKMVLEVTNTELNESLVQLNGHIPSHARGLNNNMINFGAGLNAESLVGALTQIHNLITQTPFECPTLVQYQQQAKQTSPAMLGLVMGMVQSIKGYGLSVFDFELDEAMQLKSLSGILSVATNDPATLASFTSMAPLPSIASLQIPADGTPVEVSLPMLPVSINVKAAIKGNFITLYAGKNGKSAADALATEALDGSDLLSIGLDYRKLSDILEKHKSILATAPGGCIAVQEMSNMFSQVPVAFNARYQAADYGLPLLFSVQMDKPEIFNHKLEGSYKMDILDEQCQPTTVGNISFNSDGSGKEISRPDDGSCELGRRVFTWKRNGNSIEMITSENQERFSCDQPLKTAAPVEETCYILNETDQSFQCLFDVATPEAYIIQAYR